jgi:hypothetical protein
MLLRIVMMVFLPHGNGVLNSSKCSPPGMLLHPLVDELSLLEVEISLKERKETGEVSDYIEVHCVTCVNTIQDIILEHKTQRPECNGLLDFERVVFYKFLPHKTFKGE